MHPKPDASTLLTQHTSITITSIIYMQCITDVTFYRYSYNVLFLCLNTCSRCTLWCLNIQYILNLNIGICVSAVHSAAHSHIFILRVAMIWGCEEIVLFILNVNHCVFNSLMVSASLICLLK